MRIASNVVFLTHDVTHNMLNNLPNSWGYRFVEKKGKINIGNNVIIGAGSVITKDIPSGSVAVGVPCKVIGTFEDFVEKRKSID